jgi:hypothetical protein
LGNADRLVQAMVSIPSGGAGLLRVYNYKLEFDGLGRRAKRIFTAAVPAPSSAWKSSKPALNCVEVGAVRARSIGSARMNWAISPPSPGTAGSQRTTISTTLM